MKHDQISIFHSVIRDYSKYLLTYISQYIHKYLSKYTAVISKQYKNIYYLLYTHTKLLHMYLHQQQYYLGIFCISNLLSIFSEGKIYSLMIYTILVYIFQQQQWWLQHRQNSVVYYGEICVYSPCQNTAFFPLCRPRRVVGQYVYCNAFYYYLLVCISDT